MVRRLALLLFLSTLNTMWAILPFVSGNIPRDVSIELQQPVYKDGVLSTDQGGVVTGKGLYLQAKKISYIKRQEGDKLVQLIEAEGDLLLTFKGNVYVGRKLEFNLDDQTGVVYDAITSAQQWFISAKEMTIQANGAAVLHDCTMTTNEGEQDTWSIRSPEVVINAESKLRAKNVSFRVLEMPIFWIPVLVTDLRARIHTPLSYNVKHSSKTGVRLGVHYSFMLGDNWKNKLLFDISTKRGLGGGFETSYKNPDGKQRFSAFNYYAYDLKMLDSEKRNRYRFQGKYTDQIFADTVAVRGSYDKLSDFNMPGDYINRGLDSSRAGPTELRFTRKEQNWLSSLNTKVRINNFQTVKQQLPLFQFSQRPMQLGQTGLILDNRFSAGYLDYKYAHNVHHVHNFHSSRVEMRQSLLRGFSNRAFSLTPHVGYRVIGYGNSPQHDAK
ncbi:MAG: LPS-assembly protein LptD, partial [Verrucomicrobia bacterium]|nr:LPS-assembly protein LptD [Verrucomicrobiota bacterium]